jgi:hypothetical protein
MSVLMAPESRFKPKAFAYLRRVEQGDYAWFDFC